MKNLLLLTLVSLSLPAFAPEERVIYLEQPSANNPYEAIMNAVIEVESQGDSLAFNPIEQAYGIMQIRPIRLLDYNQRTGKNYKLQDCYSVEVSKEIFMWYAVKHNPDDIKGICISWNGVSKENRYYAKVKRQFEKADSAFTAIMKAPKPVNRYDRLFRQADSVFNQITKL